MEQSLSWKANSFSARQEIPRIFRNQKVHYRVYNSLLLVHIVSQINQCLPYHPSYYYPSIYV